MVFDVCTVQRGDVVMEYMKLREVKMDFIAVVKNGRIVVPPSMDEIEGEKVLVILKVMKFEDKQ